MKARKESLVNSLINKDDETQKADISLDNVDEILRKFTERFERDIANSDIEKYIEKYAIDSPFDEISVPIKAKKANRRDVIRNTAKTKWDLIDLDTFSPKYMIALDKVMEMDKIAQNKEAESPTEEKIPWNPVDEEWQTRVQEFLNIDDEFKIDMPREVFDTVRRSYAIQGLKKKMPWMSSCKTTAKMVSDRFKKGRRKESLRTAAVQADQTDQVVEEMQGELPSWDEAEKMRMKCIEWLEKHEKLSKD